MVVMAVIALTVRMVRMDLKEVIRLIAVTFRNLDQIRLPRTADSSEDITRLLQMLSSLKKKRKKKNLRSGLK